MYYPTYLHTLGMFLSLNNILESLQPKQQNILANFNFTYYITQCFFA